MWDHLQFQKITLANTYENLRWILYLCLNTLIKTINSENISSIVNDSLPLRPLTQTILESNFHDHSGKSLAHTRKDYEYWKVIEIIEKWRTREGKKCVISNKTQNRRQDAFFISTKEMMVKKGWSRICPFPEQGFHFFYPNFNFLKWDYIYQRRWKN